MYFVIVEDEPATADIVGQIARDVGADTIDVCADVAAANRALMRASPDLVILDLVLPDGDGYGIAKQCLEQDVPFVIVSSRTLPMDVVLGLELGAADYVRKPVAPEELAARIRHALKRVAPVPTVIRTGSLLVDPKARTVSLHGELVELTPTEERILFRLAERLGSYCATAELVRTVWGNSPPSDGPLTVRVNIRRLRAKLEDDPTLPRYITNKWGSGYRLANLDPTEG